jgi:hypothetical protein
MPAGVGYPAGSSGPIDPRAAGRRRQRARKNARRRAAAAGIRSTATRQKLRRKNAALVSDRRHGIGTGEPGLSRLRPDGSIRRSAKTVAAQKEKNRINRRRKRRLGEMRMKRRADRAARLALEAERAE